MNKLFINVKRNGYDTEQCGKTFTVKELIEELKQYDDYMEVYLKNDNGYTYGSITSNDIETDEKLGDE